MVLYIHVERIAFSSMHHLILECRSYGIFRLSDPGGMSVLKECEESGFHPHGEPADGSPIYEHCANVYTNTNLRFEIFDLR
jgi:STAM-binding protein